MPSSPGQVRAIEIGRVDVWSSDLGLQGDHGALEADIDRLIESGARNFQAPGEQTLTELHLQPGPHWVRFFQAVQSTIETVVATSPARLDEGKVYLRAWATRVGPTGATDSLPYAPQDIHNHSPALLSGVYFLRSPSKHDQKVAEGTYFANPLPQSLSNPAPGLVVEAVEGNVVIFPSWVLHGPRVSPATIARDRRTVIAFDAHLVPLA